MDVLSVVLKVLAALAVIAGAIFLVVKYSEKILDFFKKLAARFNININCGSDFVDDSELESVEVAAEEQDFEG